MTIFINASDFNPCDYKNLKEITFKAILYENTLYFFSSSIFHKDYLANHPKIDCQKAQGVRITIYNYPTLFKITLSESNIKSVSCDLYPEIESVVKDHFLDKQNNCDHQKNHKPPIYRIQMIIKNILQKPA